MKENIEKLLKSGMVSNYRISKDTGIIQTTLSSYATGKSNIGNMKLDHAILLNDYYTKNWKEKVEEMETIKMVIDEVNAGRIDLVQEPSFHEMEYIDGPNGIWVVHEVEGHERLELFFAEREVFEDARQRVYEGEDASIFDDLVNNEYSDQFNYDDVVAYRVDGSQIEWV